MEFKEAMLLVKNGHTFDPKKELDLLKLSNEFGWTIAHELAERQVWFDPIKQRNILLLKDETGESVAHVMARCGYIFDPAKHRSLLYLRDNEGSTVAHSMAELGYFFDPDSVYVKLKDKESHSVAAEMAIHGFQFDENQHLNLLLMKDIYQYSVAYYQIFYSHTKFTNPQILALPNPDGGTLKDLLKEEK
jgi:hypothetical protein